MPMLSLTVKHSGIRKYRKGLLRIKIIWHLKDYPVYLESSSSPGCAVSAIPPRPFRTNSSFFIKSHIMNRFFSEYWWIFLLRGIFGVILGLLALFMPGVTFTTLIIFLGAYLLVDGIFSIVAAINARKTIDSWGWYLASGILGIVVGLLTLSNPFATGLAVLYLIAFWVIVAGLIEMVMAIRLRKEIKGEGWYIVGGLLTITFGVLILVNPIAGALTLTMIFGIYALVFGVMLIYLSFQLKRRRTY